MKIESTGGTTSAIGEARPRAAASQPTFSAAAEVHLSALAAQLQGTDETAPFDAARVTEIKQAIAEGRFTINAQAIADRLISSASELINSRQQG